MSRDWKEEKTVKKKKKRYNAPLERAGKRQKWDNVSPSVSRSRGRPDEPTDERVSMPTLENPSIEEYYTHFIFIIIYARGDSENWKSRDQHFLVRERK